MTAHIRSLKLIANLVFLFGAACGSGESSGVSGNPHPETLTIFAAASLAEALSEIGGEIELCTQAAWWRLILPGHSS